MKRFPARLINCLFVLFLAMLVDTACAQRGGGPKPQLYPNEHLKKVGQTQANADLATCTDKAAAYQHNSKQPGEGLRKGGRAAVRGALLGTAGGAIAGNTGRGAAAGAVVGATGSALKGIGERGAKDPEFQKFVTVCLEDLGYRVISWK